MITDQPAQLTFAQLFDALPDAIVYFRAVHDEHGQLVDFVIDYANSRAQRYVGERYQAAIGTAIRHDTQRDSLLTERTFMGLQAVVETGQSTEHEYFSTTLNEWLLVSRAKSGTGVLSIIRITTTRKQTETSLYQQTDRLNIQNTLLQRVLETSLNNVFVYEAIRAPTPDGRPGPIQDFRILLVNQQGRRETIANMGVDPTANTLLGVNPDSRQSGQFDLFCQVTETGKAIETEQFFPVPQLWYNTSVTKLNDGCLVTGINITAQKQAILASKRQADLLSNVLDGSSSGIKALEAVRDEQGQINDFVVVVINATGAAIRGRGVNELVGQRVNAAFPDLRETDLLRHYTEVTQTRQRRHIQVPYGNAWYDMTITPFGDGVVITYTDISESRQAKLTVEQVAAANLRQADFLNSVLDASSNGIIAERAIRNAGGTIIDFVIVSANQQAASIVHSSVDELVGHRDLELHPQLRESGLFDAYVKTVETGESQFIETYYNDGRLDYWIDANTRKLGDDELVVTFSNVSAVKRTQQALERYSVDKQQQAELLNGVLNGSISGIMSFAAIRNVAGTITDFRMITVNESSERIVGVPLATMRGNTLLTLFPGNVDSGLFDLYVNTTETGTPSRTETYYNHDGLDFWLNISAQKLGDGFVVTFSDISVVKRAAKIIEESAAELQSVIDTSQTGISLLSPILDDSGNVLDFRFRVANRMLAAYVGQQPDAIVGALSSTWFPGYQTNGLFDVYHKTYSTGEAQRFDFHYDADGIDVWLDILATKLGDEVLVTFGDYTPLKKLQHQLEASVVDLKRSNANLEQFAYVASHDLQEPLRKIQAFGDIIQTQYAPIIGDQGADMIQRMQAAAARMQLLIKDVLAYSRVATRRENVGPVNLNDVVRDVLENLETAIGDKRAIVTIEPLPTLTGDAPQLRQLLQNLLSNALKFVKPGTIPRIELTSRTVRGCDAGLTIAPPDASRLFHLIKLRDNGIGFEPHHAERIFQVFQRLHTRSNYDGTGIGLAIVHKVVENHQGYIEAEGQPGEGATFRILLPVAG